VADTEKGHKEILTESGVHGEMQGRFCIGMTSGTTASIQPATIPGLTPTETCAQGEAILKAVLTEAGIPLPTFKYDLPSQPKTTVVERGQTPHGNPIPVWQVTKSMPTTRIAMSPADLEGMSQREVNALFDAAMKQEKMSAGTPRDRTKDVVFETEPNGVTYSYTKFLIVAADGLHARAVSPLNKVPGIQQCQVFNSSGDNLQEGEFKTVDITTLGDGHTRKTTAWESTPGGLPIGYLILRTTTEDGKIPPVFENISRMIATNRIFGDQYGLGEQTKGD
jgi:hypothetical protein